MKREFSFRVFLNRSERNAAQRAAEKLGIQKMPALFRFALSKLDTDLADEILKLKEALEKKRLENELLREHLNYERAEASEDAEN